jgi:2-iminobutanoate/2-iminopropanoate deaminase
MSTKRRSIDLPGFSHKNPIPAASMKGGLVISGAILGLDPATGKPAVGLEKQSALVFEQMAMIMKEARGSVDDIVRVTVHLRNPKDRAALNVEWQKMFPDPHSRPARHVDHAPLPDDDRLISCEIIALV